MPIKEAKIELENLGFCDFFDAHWKSLDLPGAQVARVIAEHKGGYKVKNKKGEFLAKITGKHIFKAKSREDYPVVGDWVAISELDNEQAIIKAVFPRKSIIKRRFGDKNKIGEKKDVQVIAANIDVAFIIQSVGRDYNINRFERYLSIIENGGIKPVIIINKIDLITASELSLKLLEIKNRLDDIDIISTSAVNDEGLDKLKNYIEKGKTYCFLGSSGVGKSSLINKLLGKNIIKTESISACSNRGKHITTNREMYFLANGSDATAGAGGIVIDNPGTREVGLADLRAGLGDVFREISDLSRGCKFADCSHTHEPGCAVLESARKKKLDDDKYQNYLKLKKENDYYEMTELEKRENDRKFGKFMKKASEQIKKTNRDLPI